MPDPSKLIETKLKLPRNWRKVYKIWEPHISEMMFRGMHDGMKLAEATSKTKYLSGPRPKFLAPITETLRNAVFGRANWEEKLLVGRLGVPGRWAGTPGVVGGRILSHVWYGMLHEYGMGGVGKRGPWKMPKRPFLRTAIRDELPSIIKFLEASVKKGFEEAAAKSKIEEQGEEEI